MHFTLVLAQAGACVAAADLFTGAVHWLEDRYGRETWPIVGPTIIAPNRLHHEQPRAFVTKSWWQSANQQVLVALACAAALFALDLLTWQVALFLLVAVNANEIHKWAHRSDAENGPVVRTLQRVGLFQSRAHHGRHHGGERNTHYCVVTPWLNGVLDRAAAWRGIEGAIEAVSGVRPHVDPVVAARQAAKASGR